MALANLIDLIAEVAAKRTAREGNTKADTPDAVVALCRWIRANLWNTRHIFIRISVFGVRLDSA
ncbi:hypothetical protein SAMN04515678_11942 [Roseivivax sediminis]|uniref:Uncharacterized protein n=1 Tax=Roseivivax sediminis TaxID=936889 RepID=A0A1I2DZB0_9RHOB|nr:hypothetical protein SAMN04515678_11942 [Roseivivax sediminis]